MADHSPGQRTNSGRSLWLLLSLAALLAAGFLFIVHRSSSEWVSTAEADDVTGAVEARKPVAAEKVPEQPFPRRFKSPDLDGGTEWLNTSGPISLKDLAARSSSSISGPTAASTACTSCRT